MNEEEKEKLKTLVRDLGSDLLTEIILPTISEYQDANVPVDTTLSVLNMAWKAAIKTVELAEEAKKNELH